MGGWKDSGVGSRHGEHGKILAAELRAMGIKDVVGLLSSVGFSSPPSWLRPFRALSNGEHGILKYPDAQTISVQRLMPIAPPGAMPPALYARAMTAAMRTLQRVPGRK